MIILDNFKLTSEKEDFLTINNNINNGIEFKGTNLWILIFAIFIASLGLNVNSTAVIIGAMLVSPLMGPIMGLGFGMAINNFQLVKKSLFSYLFSALVSLATSTLFFLLSPINDAHSEILARTSPNIYDVLIALFGGLAGMLATSSRLKGNVIPGVAIATALMPPLCTAGYGLATLQFSFFFGAFYLFFINSVFIALAALLTTRLLKLAAADSSNKPDELKAKRIVWVVVILTLLPSIYFGYDLVKTNRFIKRANQFIDTEAIFPNDYLLKRNIDPEKNSITLTYGGQIIEEKAINALSNKLSNYNLSRTQLNIQQGFAYLQDNKNEQTNQLNSELASQEKIIQVLQLKLDSVATQRKLTRTVFNELKILYPTIDSLVLQPALIHTDHTQQSNWISIVYSKTTWDSVNKSKLKQWLKERMMVENIDVYFE